MAHEAVPEWKKSDDQILRDALAQYRGVVSEHELIKIHKNWTTLRKLAENPATWAGVKYWA